MNRAGFALLFVLMVAAAIQMLTLSTLAVATHESAAVFSAERTAIARRDAEATLRRIAREWPLPSPADTMDVGQTTAIPGSRGVVVRITRRTWGVYDLVASAPSGKAVVRQRMILRKLDLHRVMAEANDAVTAAGFVDAGDATLTAVDDGGSCGLSVPPQRLPRTLTLSSRRYTIGLPEAVVDSAHAVSPSGYAVAGVRWEEARSIADHVASGEIALTATDSTGASVVRMIYSPGDLGIQGGHGAGMLLVDGNLRMAPGSRFDGVIVVRGTASLENAQINGSLRIQGRGASSLGTSEVHYSSCMVSSGVLLAPAAARLIAAHRRFLPVF